MPLWVIIVVALVTTVVITGIMWGVLNLSYNKRLERAAQKVLNEPMPSAKMYPHIDMVVTWVDGTDQARNDLRHEWSIREARPISYTRFQERDNLRYHLRSIALYAPWIRTIYVVASGGQHPPWLEREHPRVKVIQDYDIMPAEALPSFNSHALEASISRIPGLSECFIYSCDDMYFTRATSPSLFFDTEGHPLVFRTRNPTTIHPHKSYTSCNHINAWINNAKALGHPAERPQHQMAALTKTLMEQARNEHPSWWEATIHSRFRHHHNIHPVGLTQHHALDQGIAQWITCRNAYLALRDNVAITQMLMDMQWIRRRPNLICLNEYGTISEPVSDAIEKVRQTWFPYDTDLMSWEHQ